MAEEKRGKGHPRKFPTAEDFKQKVIDYIDYCEEKGRLANIAGFCVYCDMNSDTFYAQKEYYSETYKDVNAILEDHVINSDRTTMAIFYMKNKFGYRDKIETENTNTNVNHNLNMENVSTADLERLLKNES